MALSTNEIKARSDKKRGVKAQAYKLPITVVNEIKQLAEQHGIPQNQLIIQAVELFKKSKG
ncbi:ribbon-helix-helix protein, CopG family [Seminibacterium arietis]|uniref:Ribbon-helix-helix protein, CopG family n=1 Tax=Seminibacterium arietis TaxID=1173502 RepID=A0ABW3I9F3_9PAST